MGNETNDCKGCYKEPSLGEMIDSLPIQSDIKESMIRKYNSIVDINEHLINQIRNANSEIDRLEKAVIILSKTMVKYHVEP